MNTAGARGIASSRVSLLATLALAATLGLAGCENDGGDKGVAGPPGPTGPVGPTGPTGPTVPPKVPIEDGGPVTVGNGSTLTAEEIAAIGGLVATLDSAAITGNKAVIQFTVKTSHGGPVLGLAATTLRLGIAKLVPAGSGFPSRWQSYINRSATPGNTTPGFVPALPNAIQANTETGAAAGWQEIGNGVYKYTSATDLATVTSPIAVTYEPSLTHRVSFAIDLSGSARALAPDNPFKDFVPAGGAVTTDKLIAETKNCADCHVRFAMHGGPRRSNEYCVVCHNPASTDPDGGESVDFAYMAHSIHRGNDRTSPYVVYGFNGTEYDFGEVTYPQSTLFCETCHTKSAAAPQGDDWQAYPSAASCGGCHDKGLSKTGPDPATGRYAYKYSHTAAVVAGPAFNDGLCAGCHREGGPAGGVLAVHDQGVRLAKELGAQFVFKILSVTNVGKGKVPSITFSIRKPDGTAYNIAADPAFQGNDATLNLHLAWDTNDISNADPATGKTPGGDVGTPYRMRIADIKAYAVKNADGSYTTAFRTAAVPAGITLPVETANVMVMMDGHPAVTVNGSVQRARPTSVVGYSGTARESLVSMAKCSACHEQISFHGGNRNGDPQACLVCHNSSGSDAGVGGTIAFGAFVHGIHAAKGEFSEVTYPQTLANCEACHLTGKYYTARAGALALSTAEGADPSLYTDDTWDSATAGTCAGCHDSGPAKAHMEQNGGAFGVAGGKTLTPSSSAEACAVCHGAGRAVDTAKAHGG